VLVPVTVCERMIGKWPRKPALTRPRPGPHHPTVHDNRHDNACRPSASPFTMHAVSVGVVMVFLGWVQAGIFRGTAAERQGTT